MIEYRAARPSDQRFVVYSWVRSFRDSHSAGLIDYDSWREVMTPQIERVLNRPGGRVIVAGHPEQDDADIYGWIAVEDGHRLPLVHYCYVKRSYRRMGIARRLLDRAGIDADEPFLYTCKTRTLTENLRDPLIRKAPRAQWDPLLARKSPPKNNATTARRTHGQAAAT